MGNYKSIIPYIYPKQPGCFFSIGQFGFLHRNCFFRSPSLRAEMPCRGMEFHRQLPPRKVPNDFGWDSKGGIQWWNSTAETKQRKLVLRGDTSLKLRTSLSLKINGWFKWCMSFFGTILAYFRGQTVPCSFYGSLISHPKGAAGSDPISSDSAFLLMLPETLQPPIWMYPLTGLQLLQDPCDFLSLSVKLAVFGSFG